MIESLSMSLAILASIASGGGLLSASGIVFSVGAGHPVRRLSGTFSRSHFFPLPTDLRYIAEARVDQFLFNNFEPLATFLEMLDIGFDGFLRNIVGSFILLAPFAALLPVFNKNVRTLPRTTAAMLMVSLLIELGQLGISTMYGFTYKIFDIDDIWLNTLGVLLGYPVYLAASKNMPRTSLRQADTQRQQHLPTV